MESVESAMFLEDSFCDVFHANALDTVLTGMYILDGSVDVDKLKDAFESVVLHFPILSACLDSSGKRLFLPKENLGFVLWSVLDHNKPLPQVFLPLSTVPDRIVVSSDDPIARIDFCFPQGVARMSCKGAAGKDWPLIEVCIQRFIGKTVIAIAWNHYL